MDLTSGLTTQYIPFVAVDATDLKTRETGLTGFTVYRSRNGGTLTAYTTPTIVELSSSNAPGCYALLADEDTTISSGANEESYLLHISHASMAPVTINCILKRPIVTAGQTLTVSGGSANAAVQTIANDAITAASIAADAIGSSELAASAVTEIQSGLALASDLATVATYIDTEVAAILQDTGTDIPAQIAALNNLSAAQVNAEVVDALNVDTYSEPGQEAPGASISLARKIGYLYKAFRNRKTQTASTFSLYADDGTTVDQKSTVSDDGTTATRGELVTGP